MDGVVKEFCLDPAGSDRHNMDPAGFQFHAQCPGKAHHIGLGSTVNIDVGHRLPRGVGCQIENAASLRHIGDADVTECGEGVGVQADAV